MIENTIHHTIELLEDYIKAEQKLLLEVLEEQDIHITWTEVQDARVFDVPKEHYQTVASHIAQFLYQIHDIIL